MATKEKCALGSSCGKRGVVHAVATVVFPDAAGVELPYRLCEEHAELLQGFFIELRFPDGRVIKHEQSELNR